VSVVPLAGLAPLQHQPAPLRGKIISALRRAIETGALRPGARLVERDLCAQLNVSRTSLREALRELESEGVLIQTGARGLSVAILTRAEAENAYRIRAVLEALVARQFVERAPEQALQCLLQDADALKAAYRDGVVERILTTKRQFYDRLCAGAQNALAFDIIGRLVLRTSGLRSRSMARPARQRQSVTEIDAIVDAIRARDADVAAQAAAQHVENSMRSAFSAEAEAAGQGGDIASPDQGGPRSPANAP
jgi:DNA-binding GntR family transcriptional regulator